MKECINCHIEKDDKLYSPKRNKCKECINQYQRENRRKHAEKIDTLMEMVAQLQIDMNKLRDEISEKHILDLDINF
jgi:Spy/CpxP family protein refolding chaperone